MLTRMFDPNIVVNSQVTYICDRAWEKGPCRANNDFSV